MIKDAPKTEVANQVPRSRVAKRALEMVHSSGKLSQAIGIVGSIDLILSVNVSPWPNPVEDRT